jgi:hypothetical protein
MAERVDWSLYKGVVGTWNGHTGDAGIKLDVVQSNGARHTPQRQAEDQVRIRDFVERQALRLSGQVGLEVSGPDVVMAESAFNPAQQESNDAA